MVPGTLIPHWTAQIAQHTSLRALRIAVVTAERNGPRGGSALGHIPSYPSILGPSKERPSRAAPCSGSDILWRQVDAAAISVGT